MKCGRNPCLFVEGRGEMIVQTMFLNREMALFYVRCGFTESLRPSLSYEQDGKTVLLLCAKCSRVRRVLALFSSKSLKRKGQFRVFLPSSLDGSISSVLWTGNLRCSLERKLGSGGKCLPAP